MRNKLTKENVEWFQGYLDSFINNFKHEPQPELKEQIKNISNELNSVKFKLFQEDIQKTFLKIPIEKKCKDDRSAHLAFDNGWKKTFFDEMVNAFGMNGKDTVSSVEEAVCYSYSIARLFGSSQIFYRGEQYYGNPLLSRAERYMSNDDKCSLGISVKEMKELRRFQKEVLNNRQLNKSIKSNKLFLPRINDSKWLAIMQHYDEKFGTRLIDISTSVFTGLYFSCVGWDGTIDTTKDGLLYLFTIGNGLGLPVRRNYYDFKTSEFNSEYDDIAPNRVKKSFLNWNSPEYFRIYKSSAQSPREIAQDGWFLVRGKIDCDANFGQGFKFRIPATYKTEIAKQLWLNGYTPERMIHGQKGIDGRKKLGKILGIRI